MINTIDVRAIHEPQWPMGGFALSRPVSDHRYDVDAFGQPVSSYPVNAWARGSIIRGFQPQMHPPFLGQVAYDPTDPTTWHQPQH